MYLYTVQGFIIGVNLPVSAKTQKGMDEVLSYFGPTYTELLARRSYQPYALVLNCKKSLVSQHGESHGYMQVNNTEPL